MSSVQRKDLLYPELSYKIIGSAFDVYNALGYGHHEKYYGRALGKAFSRNGLAFKEQVSYPLKYRGKVVGKNFLDFLVDGKIIVEIKRGGRFPKRHFDQVLEYLHSSGLKLAILIGFGSDQVSFKRIVNFS